VTLYLTGPGSGPLLLRVPGVYVPEHDSYLLLRTVLAAEPLDGARVLDVGTGSGVVALGASLAGAADVTAVDVSRRAVFAARLNAVLNRVRLRAVRGDLLAPVRDRQFDLILANPPYVPAPDGPPGRHSAARAWDAGPDGRVLLDRICADAPGRLAPGGRLWLVHSALCGADRTLELLEAAGLAAEVVSTEDIPFGPVLRSRAGWLASRGLIPDGETTERLVVIRGVRA
jgi:release factor glutamine methyltransferase